MIEILKKLQEGVSLKERITLHRQIASNFKKFRKELCRILETTEDTFFKIELLEIIGSTKDTFFDPAIRKIIDSEDSVEVLQTAAVTLGKLKSCNSFEMLINLLDHKSPNVRLGAIYGLIFLDEKKAVKYLLSSLDDHEPVKCWWPSPKAGGYIISKEAAEAIDIITGETFKGNKEKIVKWIKKNVI